MKRTVVIICGFVRNWKLFVKISRFSTSRTRSGSPSPSTRRTDWPRRWRTSARPSRNTRPRQRIDSQREKGWNICGVIKREFCSETLVNVESFEAAFLCSGCNISPLYHTLPLMHWVGDFSYFMQGDDSLVGKMFFSILLFPVRFMDFRAPLNWNWGKEKQKWDNSFCHFQGFDLCEFERVKVGN